MVAFGKIMALGLTALTAFASPIAEPATQDAALDKRAESGLIVTYGHSRAMQMISFTGIDEDAVFGHGHSTAAKEEALSQSMNSAFHAYVTGLASGPIVMFWSGAAARRNGRSLSARAQRLDNGRYTWKYEIDLGNLGSDYTMTGNVVPAFQGFMNARRIQYQMRDFNARRSPEQDQVEVPDQTDAADKGPKACGAVNNAFFNYATGPVPQPDTKKGSEVCW